MRASAREREREYKGERGRGSCRIDSSSNIIICGIMGEFFKLFSHSDSFLKGERKMCERIVRGRNIAERERESEGESEGEGEKALLFHQCSIRATDMHRISNERSRG